MNLEGCITTLRAVEIKDIEAMYTWENDTSIWGVSGTIAPFSREVLSRFVESQQMDIYQTRQLRLMIDDKAGRAIGAIDIFDFDPQNLRCGIGILIHDTSDRGKGYAADALSVTSDYIKAVLGLHQIWCNIGMDNAASIALFRSAGFSEIGIKKDWQRTPEGYRDEVMLQKIL